MRVKAQNAIMVGCYKYIPYNNHSYIFRIDPHAAFAAPDDDKNIYLNPSLRGI
jgi:hypothetical protein